MMKAALARRSNNVVQAYNHLSVIGSPAVYDETRSFAYLPHDRVAFTKTFPPTKDIDRTIRICQGLVQKKVVGLRNCGRCRHYMLVIIDTSHFTLQAPPCWREHDSREGARRDPKGRPHHLA